MKLPTKIAISSIAFALAGAILTLIIPIPNTWMGSSIDFHSPLFFSSLYTVLHLGAAIIFIIGLKAYKLKLRKAYSLISLGVTIIALGLAQLVFLNAFDLMDMAWAEKGGVVLPFLLSGVATFAGTQLLAKLVGVQSIYTRLSFVLPVLVGAITLVTLLPHATADMPEVYYDLSNIIIVFDTVMFGICWAVVLSVKKHIGSHYNAAMAWLAIGFFSTSVITFFALYSSLRSINDGNILLDFMLILSGIIYLKAGIIFAKTGEI
jgi:hypothetical protein